MDDPFVPSATGRAAGVRASHIQWRPLTAAMDPDQTGGLLDHEDLHHAEHHVRRAARIGHEAAHGVGAGREIELMEVELSLREEQREEHIHLLLGVERPHDLGAGGPPMNTAASSIT